MRTRKIIWLLFILLEAANGFGQSKKYVYQIIIVNRTGKAILQTGFQLKGTNGIITCLHGVAGAVSISASNNFNRIPLTGLTVRYVDLRNDLALLQTEKITGTDKGLARNNLQPRDAAPLKVLGFPEGISALNEKSVSAGRPVSNTLNGYIPPGSRPAFAVRKSPSPEIEIYYIEGNLVPGQSGAPVLDQADKVVGIVNGGIRGGAAGISWAIPIKNMTSWTLAKDVTADIQRLKDSEKDGLFASKEVDLKAPYDVIPPNMKRYYLDKDRDGYGDINHVVIDETAPDGYIEDGSDCCDEDPFLYHYKTAKTFYEDSDGDGHGTESHTRMANTKPPGYAELKDDADDTDPYLYDRSTATVFYPDQDGDGYGTAGKQKLFNRMPPGYVQDNQDLDDIDARVHPGQTAFFTTPSNGGIWDYNCDGTIQRQYTTIGHLDTGPMAANRCGDGKCCYTEGWTGPQIPEPGVAAEYGVSCNPAITEAMYNVPKRPIKINTEQRVQAAH